MRASRPKSPAKPSTARRAGQRHRERARERSARLTQVTQEIGPLPPIKDPVRRAAAETSLQAWCETYLPGVFTKPWSADHLKVLRALEEVIRHRGLFALAMPRGGGKTSLCRAACLYGILLGLHPFVVLLGATDRIARKMLLRPLKTLLTAPGPLAEDYPEACHPFAALGGEARRCRGQRLNGQLTHIEWGEEEIVFATVPGAACSGAVIQVYGLTGAIKGLVHVRPDGTSVRPTLVLPDDPQTRESARSAVQTAERLELIQADVRGMGGPDQSCGVLVPCTVIERGDLADQLLDQKLHPEWRGIRLKLLYAFPRNKKLWDEYAQIRADSLRRHRDIREATAFYRRHQPAMDRGGKPAWQHYYDPEQSISAIQFAMELQLAAPGAFASEYQNEPLIPEAELGRLTAQAVAERTSGRPRGEVPIECVCVTAAVDLHKKVLFYVVAGWRDDMTGFVVDYGTYPDQRRYQFTEASATRTLGRAYPGRGEDAPVQAGLETLATALLARDWPRAGGAGVIRIAKCLVDSGWKPGIVEAVRHRIGGGTLEASRGIGITAARRPMATYKRRPGERHGHNWYSPSVRGTREFQYVAYDVNYWKTFIHERLQVAPGDPGALTLFGRSPTEHALFAEHVAGSETWTWTSGQGREVHEWRQRPQRPDNHWFDCLVACAVAATMAGAKVPGQEAAEAGRKRKRYTQADLMRRP